MDTAKSHSHTEVCIRPLMTLQLPHLYGFWASLLNCHSGWTLSNFRGSQPIALHLLLLGSLLNLGCETQWATLNIHTRVTWKCEGINASQGKTLTNGRWKPWNKVFTSHSHPSTDTLSHSHAMTLGGCLVRSSNQSHLIPSNGQFSKAPYVGSSSFLASFTFFFSPISLILHPLIK